MLLHSKRYQLLIFVLVFEGPRQHVGFALRRADTLNQVEHTPPIHKKVLDILPGISGGVARVMVSGSG